MLPAQSFFISKRNNNLTLLLSHSLATFVKKYINHPSSTSNRCQQPFTVNHPTTRTAAPPTTNPAPVLLFQS